MRNSYRAVLPLRLSLRTLILICFAATSGSSLTAQITQDFSTSPAGTNHYVDPISPLTQHILPNTALPQTQPNAATDGNTLGYQVIYSPSRDRDVNGGLTDGELFGVVDVSVPASPTNDMGTLGIDFEDNSPPSGNNRVYVLEDPDGLTTLRFNPVMIGAATMFSMSYIIANTSFENSSGADDRVAIYLENLQDGTRTELFTASNELIPRDEVWVTLSEDLSALSGATVQLVVEFDTNASSEEMAIDNIIFSSGTILPDWPECVAPSAPAVVQGPASVCPGVPFSIIIDGDLNNATEWVIYTDNAATEEVARTSSDRFDVFTGAVPGTTYYVRGEGDCTDVSALVPLTIVTNDAADCTADATPGTSFEEPLGSSNDYFDTGSPEVAHDLLNNQRQPTVRHNFKAQELGFSTQFIPFRTGTSAEAGLTDGDAVGISDNTDFAFPDGDQGLVIEDTDGALFVLFSPVDLSGLTNVTVSFDYFINSTTYESSDSGTDAFAAGIARGLTPLEEIFSVAGDGSTGLPGLETGVWTTITYEITGNYTDPVQLIIQADFDAGTERVLIDNVSFSAGTIVCQDTDAPVVSCPEPVIIDADESCSGVAEFTATATDDCSSDITITYSQVSGSTFASGETQIMVTATDESGKSSNCTFNVTVNDVTPPVLDCPAITVQVDSVTNCAFVVPDDSLDPVATDNCGSITLLSGTGLSSLAGNSILPETTELSWTATNAAGLTSTCTQQVTVIVPPSCFPTGVTGQDASNFNAVRAVPNPFRGGTTISFGLPVNVPVGVEILDLSGRVLATDVISPSGDGAYSWYWDARQRALPAGMYYARLQAAGSVYTQRLVLVE